MALIPSQVWQVSMISTRRTYHVGILTLTVLISWPHHIVAAAIALRLVSMVFFRGSGILPSVPGPTIGSGWMPSPKVSCFRSYGSLYSRLYGFWTTCGPTGFWFTGAEAHAVNSRAVEAQMAELCITTYFTKRYNATTSVNVDYNGHLFAGTDMQIDFLHRFDPPRAHGRTVVRRNLSGADLRTFLAGFMPFRSDS